MRIALVSPLYESVPPGRYGGTERVIAALADSWSRWVTTSRCTPRADRRPAPTSSPSSPLRSARP